MIRRVSLLGCLGIMCVGWGCAPAKLQIDGVAIDQVANPASGQAVVLVKVKDARPFSADTSDITVPSMDRPQEISDSAIKARTVGRFFRAWNNTDLTDVVLPEGQSVETLVSDAVGNALRSKGYRVEPSGSAGIGVEVEITKFWMFSRLQAFGPSECNSTVEIVLKSPVTESGSAETITGSYSIHPSGALGIGVATIDDSLEDLSKNIQAKIKSP